MIEGHAAERGRSQQCLLWEVWIVQVPNVGLLWHVIGHLLETEHSVCDTYSQLGYFRMPRETGSRPLEIIWIFENHQSLGGDALRQMLRLLTLEVLLEQIDLIVLTDAAGGFCNHLSGSLRETKSRISVKILLISLHVNWFGWINVCGPATSFVRHTLRSYRDPFSVYTMLRENRQVA